MDRLLLIFAAVLQGLAVSYGVYLLFRRSGAANAWLCLLGAMLSMLTWRVAVAMGLQPTPVFNIVIAIWGSTCMFGAMFLFGREVGLRERAEAERDDLLTSERTARREAERANRSKDEFLATLSHELRTPLAVILTWCTILQKSDGNRAELARGLETIERNARVQNRLVDDMLDVTRIRAGTLRLQLAPLALDQPVRAAMQDVRPQADAKRLVMSLHCEPAPVVRGDAARLQQLVSNLLVNAVKFTPAGGSITLVIRQLGREAELEITDTGEGIEPEFLPQLFERFRQQDSSDQRRHGGLGLGLSIACDLARLHGGGMRAHSDGPGRGATFTVFLPIADKSAPAEQEPRPGNAFADGAMPRELAGMRIVVVDDEEDVRASTARLLAQMGAQVTELDSGVRIEEVLREQRPDLLLLDIGMPHEDGYSLMRRIRRLPASAGGEVPAISLTAYARAEDRERALASGFQAHLTKPVDMPLFARVIRETVQAKAEPAGPQPS